MLPLGHTGFSRLLEKREEEMAAQVLGDIDEVHVDELAETTKIDCLHNENKHIQTFY